MTKLIESLSGNDKVDRIPIGKFNIDSKLVYPYCNKKTRTFLRLNQ